MREEQMQRTLDLGTLVESVVTTTGGTRMVEML